MTIRYEEADRSQDGKPNGSFYAEDLAASVDYARLRTAPHIIPVEEQVWENSPQGRLRHIAHPKLNPHAVDIDAYIQELPPDGRSGKHRHMAEEFMFILQGRGYSLHWDYSLKEMVNSIEWQMDAPKKFEWEAGDWVYIPVNTAHQHFNSDGEEVARFICATSRIYKYLGYPDLEQLENAPGY